jgi:hypothetical protein
MPAGAESNSETPASPQRPVTFKEKGSPESYDPVFYQFTIENFGWFKY